LIENLPEFVKPEEILLGQRDDTICKNGKNPNTIRILFYFDEIEVKNPLGSAAGVYKVGQFYFSILNLTRKHNSSLKNIFCIASAFNEDLKTYGFNRILEPIITDLKFLEKNGITIKNETFFASIFQVDADLGLHQIFGIKCCFRGENLCHLCNASSNMKLIITNLIL
jgi:hypothetical protein